MTSAWTGSRLQGAAIALAVFGMVAFTAARADAQAATDGGWHAYFGCWQPIAAPSSPSVAGEEGRRVCVIPAEGSSVSFITIVNDSVVDRLAINTTGARSPVSREGCTGWESATRGDAGRVYLRSEYTCEGGLKRTSSGLIAMLSPEEWIDIQNVGVGESSSIFLQRYSEVSPPAVIAAEVTGALRNRGLAISTARVAGSAAVSLSDIADASSNVDAAAVEGWLLERRQGFVLEGKHVLRMADAGVPDRIIDVVVALSYPQQLDTELARRRLALYPAQDVPVNSSRVPSADYPQTPQTNNFYYENRDYRDDYYHGGYRRFHRHYSPFGYYPYGYYGNPYYGDPYFRNPRPRVIIIRDGNGGGGGGGGGGGDPVPVPPPPQGRAINGGGYTNGSQPGGSSSTSTTNNSAGTVRNTPVPSNVGATRTGSSASKPSGNTPSSVPAKTNTPAKSTTGSNNSGGASKAAPPTRTAVPRNSSGGSGSTGSGKASTTTGGSGNTSTTSGTAKKAGGGGGD